MTSKYVVKVQYESTLRRFALGESDLDFSRLESRTRDLFQIAPTALLLVTYTDKDGDVVTMAGDEDLNDALVLQAINPLRLSVTVVGTQKSSPVAQPAQKSSPSAQPVQSGGILNFIANLARASSVLEEKPQAEEGEIVDVKLKTEKAIGDGVGVESKTEKAIGEGVGVESKTEKAIGEGVGVESKTEEPIGEGVGVESKTEEPIGEGVGVESKTEEPIGEGVDVKFKTEEASGEGVDAVSQETDSVVVEERPATVDAAEQVAPTVTDTKNPVEPAAAEEIHTGIQCDSCHTVPIKGARFKSISRFNYDLCQPCFESSGSAPGAYVKIDRNVNNFHPFLFVPSERSGFRHLRRPGPQCTKDSCGGVPCDPNANSESKAPACAPAVDAATVPAAGQSSDGEKKVVKHPGVTCDGCGMSPLVGPRMISRTRWNYDLCSGCFENSGADADQFQSVQEPENPFLPGRLFRSVSRPCGPRFGQYVWVWKEESDSEADQKADEGEEAKTEVFRPAEAEASVQTDSVKQSEVAVAEAKSEASDVAVAKEAVKEELVDPKDVAVEGEDEAVEVKVPAEAVTGTKNVQNVPVAAPEEDLSTQEGLLAKLSAMGFTDQKLNVDILEKNKFDLRKTLDDLCTAEEWNPILENLLEMGFYDTAVNRSLMFKYNGNVKLVVKELVQMSKTVGTGKAGKQE